MEKEGNNLFQVNLKGMIALLSEHIYSNPNTFVRKYGSRKQKMA